MIVELREVYSISTPFSYHISVRGLEMLITESFYNNG